jgi:hypothetical protein
MLPELFGTIETTSTYDKIYNIFKAKQRVMMSEESTLDFPLACASETFGSLGHGC